MKKILLFMLMLSAGLAGFSQQTTTVVDTAKTAHKQNAAAWACPSCFKITKDGGNCTTDKSAKIQLGTYYCQHCIKATGSKPGECPVCKGATTQMTRRLCNQHKEPVKRTA